MVTGTKFSQIASGSALVVATDQLVALRSSTTDVLVTPGTLAALNAAPAGTLTGATLASNVVSTSITSVAAGTLAASATTDTTNAANISSGTIPSARLGGVGGTYLGDAVTTAQTITLIEYAPYAFTINSLRNLGTVGGTATGTLNINGTPVTGCSSLSLTSSPQTGTATAANAVSVGNTVTFVTSAPSSLTGLVPFSLIGTR
jgi:hypothetical protein